MPEPKSKFTSAEIGSQFYQLNMVTTVSSNGYIYRLDVDEHESSVNYGRSCYNSAREDFQQGNITSEEYNEHYDMYMETLHKYVIIDEDDKICGEYSSKTRNYVMFLWRFTMEGRVYYHDVNMEVWSYANSYVGRLSSDMREIIRNVASDSDSDSDSDYEDEDEVID
jgi:hypothetical protein